MRILDSGAVSL